MVFALSALVLNFFRYGKSSPFTKSIRSSPVVAFPKTGQFRIRLYV